MNIKPIFFLIGFIGLSGWWSRGMAQSDSTHQPRDSAQAAAPLTGGGGGGLGGGSCPGTSISAISASATSICSGTLVTFSVTSNGNLGSGVVQSFNWLVNGSSVQNTATSTFKTSTLHNGDRVQCDVVVNPNQSGCTSFSNPSNTITMTVTTLGTPSAPSGSTSLCQGSGATAYTTSATNATSYTWSLSPSTAGTISGSSTTGTVTWSASYSGTATVSVAANGCTTSSTVSTTVTVSPTVVAPSVSGPVTLCQESAATNYPATATGATSFSWTLSPSSAATVSGDNVAWVNAFSGTATLTVMAFGCGGPKTTTVIISVTPDVGMPSAPSGATTVCQASAATAYTTSAANATSYSWSISPSSAGTISGTGTTGTVSWSPSYSGTATVSVTANGCNGASAAATTSVTVTPTVGAPSAPSGATTVCQASAVTTYTTSGTNATSYSWSINPSSAGTIGGTGTTGTVSWNASFTGTATISVTASGCNGPSAAASTSVTVTPTVGVPSAPAGTMVLCQASGLTPYTTSATNATSYTWSLSPSSAGTISGTGTTGTVNWNSSFTGTATIAVTASGCNGPSAAASTTVSVTPSVAAPSAPTGSTSFCQGSAPVTYTTGVVSNATGYTWSISPASAGTISGSGTSGTVTWSGSFSGTATIGVATTGCNASTTPVTTAISVIPFVGTPSAPSGPAVNNSANGPAVYTTSATNASAYTWSVTPGEAGTITPSGNTASVAWNQYYNGQATIGVMAAGCNGPSPLSTATVSVYMPLAGGVVTPGSVTLASGSDPGLLTAPPATGGNPASPYVYQWMQSTDGVNFSAAAGASTGENYDPGPVSAGTWFERQVTCGTDMAYSNAAQITIGTPPGTGSLNYVRTRTLSKPLVTDTVTADGLTSPFDVQQTTQYLDGLGRPVQTVAKQASPLQNDQVTIQVYDPLGREVTQYLPYTSSSHDGNYKSNALAEQNSFIAAQYPGEQFYYGQTVYEPSPLNRPLSTYAPGGSWVGSGRGVSTWNQINTAADSVANWTISPTPGSLPVTTANYPSGALFKTVTTDEAGHQVVEYKDQQGKTVLRKVQQSGAPASGPSGWLNTYYVFDDLDNLRSVIPPLAVQWLQANGWNFAASGGSGVASGLCYRYEYDYRKRAIIKKLPGAGEVHFVYDVRDRLVMTQDSNLRATKEWLVTVYDGENRPDSVGLITDATNYNNLAFHTNAAQQSAIYPPLASYPLSLLKQTYYDDYAWVTALGSVLTATMDTSFNSNTNFFLTTFNSSPSYAVPMIPSYITRGEVTGTKQFQLGTTQAQYSVDFYDDRGRVIEVQSTNYTTGLDKEITQYDFSGKPLRQLLATHKNGNLFQAHNAGHAFTYDAAFRLTGIRADIDNNNIIVDTLIYDELGQLQKKVLGGGIDSEAYSYNIRGWVTGINKNYIAGTATDYFGLELAYDKQTSVSTTTYAAPQFNGNITGLIWKSAGDQTPRKYDFSYDNTNRLVGAAFLQNPSPGTWNKTAMDYSVDSLNYDANGNIVKMNQHGFKVGAPTGLIDQLSYTYPSGSNQLQQVVDAVNDTASTLGDFHYKTKQGSTDYTYDGNGNLKTDANKGIDSIQYNYLNLPQYIHIKGKGIIQYAYDANGLKEAKIVTDSTQSPVKKDTTEYIKAYQYENDSLKQFNFEEGRARFQKKFFLSGDSIQRYYFDYFLKDHLGNTRVILTNQRDTGAYVATMEPGSRATERALFYNIDSTSFAASAVPGGFPNDQTSPNDSVAMVSGNTHPVGPAIILKMMSGDSVSFGVQSYYVGGLDVEHDKLAAEPAERAGERSGIAGRRGGACGLLDLG